MKKFTFAVVCLLIIYCMPFVAAAEPKTMISHPFAAAKGPYEIGTTCFTWMPKGQRDKYVGQIWYPAIPAFISTKAYYLPASTYQMVKQDPQFAQLENFLTDADINAPLLKKERAYPVLLFSPGLGLIRQQNTFMFEYLASRGFIVVSVDHPGSSGLAEKADGSFTLRQQADYNNPSVLARLDEERGRQLSTVLDTILKLNNDPGSKIYKAIDTNKIGVFGHSEGGITALRASAQDKRFKAAVNLDGLNQGEKPYNFNNQEILMVSADIEERLDRANLSRENYLQTKKEFAIGMNNLMLSPKAKKYLIYCKGAEHMNFTDIALFPAPPAVGPADAQTMLLSVSALLTDFFNGAFSETGSTLVKTNYQYPYTELIRFENDLVSRK